MKKIFLALMAGVMLVSCDLNFFPSDETNSDVLLQDPSGAEYIMDGCYAVLKDEVEFLGYSSGNTFARHYFQMSEFPADNACLSAHTTDDLYQATALVMTDNLKNVGTLWMLAYKVAKLRCIQPRTKYASPRRWSDDADSPSVRVSIMVLVI